MAFETTYPADWIDHYVSQRFHTIDPVIVEGRRRLAPFSWGATPTDMTGEVCPADDRQRHIFNLASDFGIQRGLAIPIQGAGSDFAMLNVAMPPQEMAPETLHRLHIAGLYFHIAMERLGRPEAPSIRLTEREKEVLTWLSIGKTFAEIGDILSISERTVIYHLEKAKTKLQATTRQYAVVKAVLLGLIRP